MVRIGTDTASDRASAVSCSTTAVSWWWGMLAAVACRNASERTFHGVHDDFSDSTTATTVRAVRAIQRPSGTVTGTAGWWATACQHPFDPSRAEQCGGFGGPGEALVVFAARFVFVRPGVEGRPLRQFEALLRGGQPAVLGFELGDQFAGLADHLAPSGRPAFRQGGVDAGDLVDGSFPVPPGRHQHQAEIPQPADEAGGVRLGQGHLGGVQHFRVDRHPFPGLGLDLVRDRHMGVQVGSPARESRCTNRAAIRPRTGRCRTPGCPLRVNSTLASR